MANPTNELNLTEVQAYSEKIFEDTPNIFKNLMDVSKVARYLGNIPGATALLQGVLESGVSYMALQERFGTFVADCVQLVSDDVGVMPVNNRPARYRDMNVFQGKLEVALIVKTADYLTMLRVCMRNRDYDLMKRYQKDHHLVKRDIFVPGLVQPWWDSIESIIESGIVDYSTLDITDGVALDHRSTLFRQVNDGIPEEFKNRDGIRAIQDEAVSLGADPMWAAQVTEGQLVYYVCSHRRDAVLQEALLTELQNALQEAETEGNEPSENVDVLVREIESLERISVS